MSELVKADLDHLEKNEEDSTDNVMVEIDAGVYYEVKETQINEDIVKLEEELASSGKKPFIAGRLIKNPKVFIWVLALLASVGGFLFGVDQV